MRLIQEDMEMYWRDRAKTAEAALREIVNLRKGRKIPDRAERIARRALEGVVPSVVDD